LTALTINLKNLKRHRIQLSHSPMMLVMVLLSLAKAVWCLSRPQNTLSRTKGVIRALAPQALVERVAFLGHPEWLSRLLRALENNIKRERGTGVEAKYAVKLLRW
jgi:hypothetical protein